MAKKQKENIIQLLGKEPKKQMKRTHQAIQKAFKDNGRDGKSTRRAR